MSAEISTSPAVRGQSSDRVGLQRANRSRLVPPKPRGMSTDRFQTQCRSAVPVRDASPRRLESPSRGNNTERKPSAMKEFRSRTVSPSRRSNYCQINNSETEKGILSKQYEDTERNATSKQKQRPRSSTAQRNYRSRRNNPGDTKIKAKENNKCFGLIDEVSRKILEINDTLNIAEVNVLVDRLREKLMEDVKDDIVGSGVVEPSQLYREESNYRLIKSEHQHQKLMVHCGLKKKIKHSEQKLNALTKGRCDNNKNKHGFEFIKYSGNSYTDDWDSGLIKKSENPVKNYDNEEQIQEMLTSKASRKISANKKKSVAKTTSKPKKECTDFINYNQLKDMDEQEQLNNKIDKTEDVLSVEDLNNWRKLPEAVDKLMNYIDGITSKQDSEVKEQVTHEIVNYDKSKKGLQNIGELDRREKIKSWDLQRRLTLGVKVETRATERKNGGTSADVISNNDNGNSEFYLDYSDSKMDIFIPNNNESLYEGIFSGGDITCLRKANQKRPVTVEGQRLNYVIGDITGSQRDNPKQKFKRTSSVQRTSVRSKF